MKLYTSLSSLPKLKKKSAVTIGVFDGVHVGHRRLLENAILRWIGRLSYSLYIWQQVFLGQKQLDWYPLRLLAHFALAVLSFYFIEKPMMRWGYKLAPPPSPGHNDLVTKRR